MNLDIFDRRRAERFAQLLDETNGGRRHHARGQADEELAELAAIGRTLTGVRPAVNVDPEFRTSLRAMLVATAERDGIGVTASTTETAPGSQTAVREPLRGLLTKGGGRRIRARGAIVFGVAAGALAVSGFSAASESAVPGDALYGVKRSTERAQWAMAGSTDTRGQLSLDFARNRLAEAVAMKGDNADFPKVLADMDDDTKQGVRLLTTSAADRQDPAPLAVIDTFVGHQRRLISPMVPKLSPANQERALASMSLLDDIDRRARALRNGMECDSPTVGTDALGPKPRGCRATADESGEESQQNGGQRSNGRDSGSTRQQPKPAAGPSDEPSSTPAEQGPVLPNLPSGVVSAVPTQTPAGDKDVSDEDDGGLLGNLFGGVLG